MTLANRLTKILLFGLILGALVTSYFLISGASSSYTWNHCDIRTKGFEGKVQIQAKLKNSFFLPSLVFVKLGSEQLKPGPISDLKVENLTLPDLQATVNQLFGTLRKPSESFQIFVVLLKGSSETDLKISYTRVLTNSFTPPQLDWLSRPGEADMNCTIHWDSRYRDISWNRKNEQIPQSRENETKFILKAKDKFHPKFEWKYRQIFSILEFIG